MRRPNARVEVNAHGGDVPSLRAADLARAFARGGDIQSIVNAHARTTTGKTNDDGEKETSARVNEDVVTSARAIARSYENARNTVEVKTGYDFKAIAVDAERASWSLLPTRAGREKRSEGDDEKVRRATTSNEEEEKVNGKEVKVRERASGDERTRARTRKTRAIRESTTVLAVLGVESKSGVDDIARAFCAREEKAMLETWRANAEDWREDYKRKRRAALRRKKGNAGTTITA